MLNCAPVLLFICVIFMCGISKIDIVFCFQVLLQLKMFPLPLPAGPESGPLHRKHPVHDFHGFSLFLFLQKKKKKNIITDYSKQIFSFYFYSLGQIFTPDSCLGCLQCRVLHGAAVNVALAWSEHQS